ncbi:unnamed protein product [Miscanthus lutarioriparius]|uniref:Uncharacterized protein n=1 Tax=Miscanthus lutarioriparius TaxID=422564 RepID=A0A811SPA2_9POAL|nr:unnamed protein product [Miscanthus lutarioriparius]
MGSVEYLGVAASDSTLFINPVYGIVTITPSCYGANPLGTSKTGPVFHVAYGGPGGIYILRPG